MATFPRSNFGNARTPSVQVEGKLFTGVPSSAMVRAARRTQKFALDATQDRSRVDTGTMKRSFYTDLKTSTSGISLSINNDVFYAKYQEFGTKNIPPMLAATKSIGLAKTHFQAEVQKELQSELGGRLESIERATQNALSVFFRGLR